MTDAITEDRPLIVADIEKNRREPIRVSMKEFKGKPFAHVRVFYNNDGDLKQTGKGVTIRPDFMPALIDALRKVEAEALRRGLL